MKPRNTLIAFIVLLAVGAYVYLVEIQGGAKKKAQEESSKKLWDVTLNQVTGFTLTRADGTTLSVSREGEKWRITAPQQAEGDDFTPSDVARALAELKKESVVEESPAPDAGARYGLDKPSLAVSFTGAGGQSGELQVGRKNPIGSTHYARIPGKPEVFLVDAFSVTALDKDLFAMRNKKLLDFKEDDVRGITLELAGQTCELAKEGSRWWLTSPVRDVAREEAIKSLLGALRFAEATSFVAETAGGLAAYGLDAPRVRLTLRVGEAAATQSLLVGAKPAAEDGAYVKRGEKPGVAVGPATLLTDLQKGPTDLQENRAFPFDRWNAREVEVLSGNTGIKLARAEVEVEGAKQQTGDWQVAEIKDGKAGELKRADWRATDDYLKALSEITAQGFLPSAPPGVSFEPSTMTVKVTLQKEEGVRTFALAITPDGSGAYVRDPERPVVLSVAPDAKATLGRTAAELTEKPVEAPAVPATPAGVSS